MSRIWAGIDSGTGHHHALADSRRVTWAIDMTGGEPALLPALLVNHGQEVLYMPGRLVNRASDGHRGEGRTDTRDAYVIADQARMRRDLWHIRPSDEAAIELRLPTGRRAHLVEERTRVVNRLRGTLLSMSLSTSSPTSC